MQTSGLFENCIQIAGVVDAAEAALLRAAGVRLLGFPLRLPVHREDLGEAEAARLIRTLPSDVHAILITYLDEAREIAGFADALGVAAVQLHGEIDPGELERLRGLRPGLATLKSLVVGRYSEADLGAQVLCMSPYVDAFITDTFDPVTGASGATGKTHDWAVSRALVERSPRPVILAGGLTPANVRSAIRAVRPAGVDAHTGVEGPDGRKDPALVRRFVAEARAGFADLAAPGGRRES